MKATLLALGTVLVAAAATMPVHADPYYPPSRVRQAPDMCGPGYYCSNPYGMVYGPNYCVRPPWEPFNGFRPNLQKDNCPPALFPMHLFVRSPRDYFMVDN